MLRGTAIVGLLAIAGCGGEGDLARCRGDADCAAGTLCEVPVAGEKGVCIAPYEVALTAPAAAAWVGAGGARVAATAAVRSARVEPPAQLALVVDGAPAGALLAQGDGTYQGSWSPGTGAATASLRARAAFPGGAVDSPDVPVQVDGTAPRAAIASAACAPRCFRNSVLHVAASVSDANLSDAWVSVDLDGHVQRVPLAGPGAARSADLDLGAWPFPMLSGNMTVRVTARDVAGNEAAAEQTVDATRVRWVYTLGPAVTSPAVMSDGTLVVGVGNNDKQLRGIDGLTGTEKWSLKLEAVAGSPLGVGVPPSIGSAAIYVGGADGYAYAVKLDGSAVLNAACNTGGPVTGPPAVGNAGAEFGFVASSSGYLLAFDAATACSRTQRFTALAAAPSLDSSGDVLVGSAAAVLRAFKFDGLGFAGPTENLVGTTLSAPLAVDKTGGVITASADAAASQLNRTASGVTQTLKTLPGSVTASPVVLSNGDIVVGDATRTVHRYSAAGARIWSTEPVLDGVPGSPLALAGGDAVLLVPTQNGSVYAIGAQGQVVWSGALNAGSDLREPNVFTPPGSALSLAYLGSSLGKLYAVIVDGRLDAAAPWPRAFHDPANTSSAATPLP